ncbi:MAG: ATP-binding protein [Bacteroidales bacterium]
MNTTKEFKEKVTEALLRVRQMFDGSDAMFAKQQGLSAAVFSRLKGGETERIISEAQWLNIGRRLGVTMCERRWNIARTDVFNTIEEEVLFCAENSKARIFIDDCGIGKTFTAKYMSRNVKNCFYIDASQCKTKNKFIRLLARTLGVDGNGTLTDVLEGIKYYLTTLPRPVVIIDEAGDMEYSAFLEIKALWNATEGVCGWYMIGADGLAAKIERGIVGRKVGFREIFSRFSEKYSKVTPVDKQERKQFYRKLIGDVLAANTVDKELIPEIVNKCLIQVDGNIGGLRRAESLLLLMRGGI